MKLVPFTEEFDSLWKEMRFDPSFVGFFIDYPQDGNFEERDGLLVFGVMEDGEPIGFGTLSLARLEPQILNLGVAIKKTFQKKGFSTLIAQQLVKVAFGLPQTHKVMAVIRGDMPGQDHVLLKCGFVREGVYRQTLLLEDKRVDEHIYGIFREEFERKLPCSVAEDSLPIH